MQTLSIISVNIWQMLISLANLAILYWLISKFLYKPVKNMLEKRQSTIDGAYKEAEDAKNKALSDKEAYEQKLLDAKTEADGMLEEATQIARNREDKIIKDAKTEAEGIINRAREQAELETKKAENAIKDEIVKVGTLIAEKMIDREISAQDHKNMIDSFIEEIGDDNEGNN